MGEGKAIAGVLYEVKHVAKALVELGHTVTKVPLLPPLEVAKERIRQLQTDLVFNLFEGFDGSPETEAVIAGFMEEVGLTHTGCPGQVLALALDKPRARAAMQAAGIITPRFQVLSPATLTEFDQPFPVIVKPAGEHASHGISGDSVVNDLKALERQVKKVSELFGGKAMVEEFLEGREFNATVLGNSHLAVLPVSEIVYTLPPGMPKVLTFAGKWEPRNPYYKGTNAVCPADITPALHEEIAQVCLAAFKCLGCRAYARVDMRLNAAGQVVVLEVNPNPDISPELGAARQAGVAGMSYTEFIGKIVTYAIEGD